MGLPSVLEEFLFAPGVPPLQRGALLLPGANPGVQGLVRGGKGEGERRANRE